MDALYSWIASNWLYTIAAVLSFLAAYGFLVFLRGFLYGARQLLYIDADAHHLDHARDRTVRGVLIMVHAFVIWVFVDALVSYFTNTQSPQLTIPILGAYAVVALAVYVREHVFGKKH